MTVFSDCRLGLNMYTVVHGVQYPLCHSPCEAPFLQSDMPRRYAKVAHWYVLWS